MGFQLSPGIKGCSDVVKAKLFFIPCCSLASASQRTTGCCLFLHCGVTRLKKKELLVENRWIEDKKQGDRGCSELHVLSDYRGHPQGPGLAEGGMKLWVWRWGFVAIHHSCSFPPFSLFFQSQVTATPGDRRREATSEFSLWEAAQYQNKLGLCFGQGTSNPGVMSTCDKYQIGTLQHVLKEPQIVVLNESAQRSPFLPEFGVESVWTPE